MLEGNAQSQDEVGEFSKSSGTIPAVTEQLPPLESNKISAISKSTEIFRRTEVDVGASK